MPEQIYSVPLRNRLLPTPSTLYDMMGAAGAMGGCGTPFGNTKLCVSVVGQQVWSELNIEYLQGRAARMGQNMVGRNAEKEC